MTNEEPGGVLMTDVSVARPEDVQTLQILYWLDVTKSHTPEAVLRSFYTHLAAGIENPMHTSSSAATLVQQDRVTQRMQALLAQQPQIDGWIRQASPAWRLERMNVVDRNILRLGVYMLLHKAERPAVVIDQAVALAQQFSTSEALAFVRGVLERVRGLLET